MNEQIIIGLVVLALYELAIYAIRRKKMNDNTCVCCGEPRMTLEEILEKLHSPTEHAITLENGELTALLEELKELREENKVLMLECERLIKEKGELLNKVSGGDVLRIGQLEEQLEEAKRLLKAAVEDIRFYVDCYESHCDECCCDHDNHCHWKHEAEALKLIGGN